MLAAWIFIGVLVGFVGGFFIAYVMYNPKFERTE